MSDDPYTQTSQSTESNAGQTEGRATSEAWDDVGQQFKNLGVSLGAAFKAAWSDPNNQKQLRMIQDGVEEMVNEVRRAVEDAAQSPQGQQVRSEVGKAADSLKTAGEQTYQEVRPHLVSALQSVNVELQKLMSRMENRETPAEPQSTGAGDEGSSASGPGSVG